MFDLLAWSFVVLLIFLVVYYKRHAILALLPAELAMRLPSSWFASDYTLLPSTFQEQAEQGYSTSAFDLEGNISDDARVGLDSQQLDELREIMRRKRVNFDEARLIRQRMEMRRNGIDPDTGLPIDAKAVTRL
ncbi:hypothetical protein FRC14_003045 [Serendipita sp. 396]|nr:hypothetical protein FRC14_003045 [Serendipita sp. 396]KAG8776610.1 hypothetical protein FRC15_011870 [Serendipita sp. 397]KAG8792831.1 hypothetical protein FRC16_011241 [Serendipita sp. 398]KAG8826121.1 hypothetical protein FRC19_009648 [Serendipita sp. 401]KAG8836013.1 hypothetical protein FRC18_012021 [Serendipita sp. 400]KAG8846088.1 hypothetical protein FRB91_001177 [Serendipita sp. 411]KAG8859470.1 hypothetical protein FRC20_011827 [Serendipita sp. 405]KAG9056586.1 hypothetical prot